MAYWIREVAGPRATPGTGFARMNCSNGVFITPILLDAGRTAWPLRNPGGNENGGAAGARLISPEGAGPWRPEPGRFYVLFNHGTGLRALRPL